MTWTERFKEFIANQIMSRKFIVWATACVFLGVKFIDQQIWLIISGLYLGANIVDQKLNSPTKEPCLDDGKGGITTYGNP